MIWLHCCAVSLKVIENLWYIDSFNLLDLNQICGRVKLFFRHVVVFGVAIKFKMHFELSLKRDNELKAIKEERHKAKETF